MSKFNWAALPIENYFNTEFDRLTKVHSESFQRSELNTGFSEVDKILLGFQPGHLYLLATRPCIGKTTLLLNVAINISELHKKTLFISPVTSGSQVAQRILSCKSGIKMSKIATADLSTDEIAITKKTIEETKTLQSHLNLLSTPLVSVNDIRQILYSYSVVEKPTILIIDDVDQLRSKCKTNNDKRLSLILLQLMKLAQDLNIPVFVSAGLNSKSNKTGSGMPQLRDLTINNIPEHFSSVVMFLYRPEYYINDKRKSNSLHGEIYLRIAKNEIGNLSSIKLKYDPSIQKFNQ